VAAAGPAVPRFSVLLDDLAAVDERALRARGLPPAALLALVLLKVAPASRRLASALRPWADQIRAVLSQPGGAETFGAMVTYITLVSKTPQDQLRQLFADIDPRAEEAYVTTAEMLRAEGREEGRQEGRAEGRISGRAEALAQLLAIKFGPLDPGTLATVNAASSSLLETWTARVLAAGTLEQVLAADPQRGSNGKTGPHTSTE
jgi:hypothetical protein